MLALRAERGKMGKLSWMILCDALCISNALHPRPWPPCQVAGPVQTTGWDLGGLLLTLGRAEVRGVGAGGSGENGCASSGLLVLVEEQGSGRRLR